MMYTLGNDRIVLEWCSHRTPFRCSAPRHVSANRSTLFRSHCMFGMFDPISPTWSWSTMWWQRHGATAVELGHGHFPLRQLCRSTNRWRHGSCYEAVEWIRGINWRMLKFDETEKKSKQIDRLPWLHCHVHCWQLLWQGPIVRECYSLPIHFGAHPFGFDSDFLIVRRLCWRFHWLWFEHRLFEGRSIKRLLWEVLLINGLKVVSVA